MHFNDIEFAAIDFESTGFDASGADSPIQVGIASMHGGEIDPGAHFRRFIAPESPRPVSHAARSVHRIEPGDLEGAPTLMELWPEMRERLTGRVLVAHGAGTEKRFLGAFPLHPFGPWLDTLQIARKMLPREKDHSLSALAKRAGLEAEGAGLCPDLGWHDALFDAVSSLLLLRFMVRRCGIEEQPLQYFEALEG